LIVASGGTAAIAGAGLVAAAAALGFSVYTVCSCAEYVDEATFNLTDFESLCEGDPEPPPI
jgi:hypothetical protein